MMIIQFFLGIILLLIIACTLFMLPFIRKSANQSKNSNTAARNQLNRDLYETRLAELENDESQGIIVDKDKIIEELQYNLLDDVIDADQKKSAKKSKFIWLPGLFILLAGSISLYSSVGGYQQLSHWDNVLQRYPALKNKLFNDKNSRPSEQDLKDIMLGLRTHLSVQANDADGWLLYTRLAMFFKDADSALDAAQKAYLLNPQSLDAKLTFIELKMQGDEYSQQQAELMLKNILATYPDLIEAWSMYAFIALEKQDFNEAKVRWEKMLTLVDAGSEQEKILHDSIAYANTQLQVQQARSEQMQIIAPSEHALTTNKVVAIGQAYQVTINISESVNLPEGGSLFVFAQLPAGPKMPIAAVKLPLNLFPIKVELSDANAMTAGMKLSDYPEFIIKARITTDENATSGKWQGQSEVVERDSQNEVKIVIDEAL
ncbi:c-type cytochrome biogenesis protein CcmI [Psychromonas sp. MME2]|uniref:c-type cytochrome biogenesis protein CcmI n=1 Tax=unclassified Psychromonas TaxID=2614957 RepID=UPI00339CF476